jgi:hypothetical protein
VDVYDKAHPLLTLTPAMRLEVVTIAERAPGSQGSPSARPPLAHASIERSVRVPCNAPRVGHRRQTAALVRSLVLSEASLPPYALPSKSLWHHVRMAV